MVSKAYYRCTELIKIFQKGAFLFECNHYVLHRHISISHALNFILVSNGLLKHQSNHFTLDWYVALPVLI